jgi:hypothetical protein
MTKTYHYPMPDATDSFHFTKGDRYWSLTDIKDAFFTVTMEPTSRQYTAFTTPGGRYEFTVMPQGAQNSPMFFADIAADTFKHIPKSRLINFIDDTTNHSRRFYTHWETQQMMYDAMRDKKMVAKMNKSHYLYPSAKVLGHIMSEFGRTPAPDRIQPILDMAEPKTLADLRSFLGLINFNREYLYNAKRFLGPLEELLKKDKDVARDWKPEIHGVAFKEAKIALTTAPCLLTIDVTKPFVLHVDACRNGRGIGAVLLQQNENNDWRPVAYYSYRLKEGERTRCATELEAMALVYAIKHWSPYLRIQEFTAIVDHHALLYLVTQPAKTQNVRILNWISELHAYRFNIYHRSGKKHLDADAISRLMQYQDLDIHDAMDTTDGIPPVNGPATTEDILNLHKILGLYKEQLEYLRTQLEEEHQEKLQEHLHQAQKTVTDKREDIKARTDTYKKMAKQANGDYWKLITSPEWLGTQYRPPDDEQDTDYLIPITPEEQANITFEEAWISQQPPDLPPRHTPEMDKERPPLSPYHEPEHQEEHHMRTRSKTRREVHGTTGEIHEEPGEGDQQNSTNISMPKPLLRKNYLPPQFKRRKQYIADHTPPLAVPPLEHREDDLDTQHPAVSQYSNLEWKIFQDPTTKRIYQVTLVYYEHEYETIAAYRKVLDDMPPDPFDSFPWRIDGPTGIKALVDKYRMNNINSIQGTVVPWPNTETDMLTLQSTDPNWQPIIARILRDGNDERQYQYTPKKQLYVPKDQDGQNGAMRICDPEIGHQPDTDRIVLPLTLVPTILQYYHDQQAHPGSHRTTETIRNKYWWPTLQEDTKTYVQSCQFCNCQKTYKRVARVPIQQYLAPARPWDTAHIDITGQLPTTRSGNKIIIVAKCPLTKTIEIGPLPDKKPITVAKFVIDRIYHRHGAPRILHSDQGTEFLNAVQQQIHALYQVKSLPTTPGNPRANGTVENHNNTLKQQLTNFTNARQDDWDTYLSTVQFAYMTTVNEATGFTPFFLLYGREASQPHETWISAFAKVPTLNDYIKKLVNTLQFCWEYVAMLKPKDVERMNKIPLKRHKFVEFDIGDRFFLKYRPLITHQHYSDPKRTKTKLTPKLQFRFVGPYTVTKKFSPVLYEAQVDGELRTVHALQMKPDPVSKYYTMHRTTPGKTEEPKTPAFKPSILPSGKPYIPRRAHRRLKSPKEKPDEPDDSSSSDEEDEPEYLDKLDYYDDDDEE